MKVDINDKRNIFMKTLIVKKTHINHQSTSKFGTVIGIHGEGDRTPFDSKSDAEAMARALMAAHPTRQDEEGNTTHTSFVVVTPRQIFG